MSLLQKFHMVPDGEEGLQLSLLTLPPFLPPSFPKNRTKASTLSMLLDHSVNAILSVYYGKEWPHPASLSKLGQS